MSPELKEKIQLNGKLHSGRYRFPLKSVRVCKCFESLRETEKAHEWNVELRALSTAHVSLFLRAPSDWFDAPVHSASYDCPLSSVQQSESTAHRWPCRCSAFAEPHLGIYHWNTSRLTRRFACISGLIRRLITNALGVSTNHLQQPNLSRKRCLQFLSFFFFFFF